MEYQLPKRIQRKRIKDWRMPAGTIYVGRPTMWGNPYTGPNAVERYRAMSKGFMREDLIKLRGKDLACWCSLNQPCHADVLLKLANSS